MGVNKQPINGSLPSKESATSTAPIDSKSSGTSITPARKPIRRCAGSSGASGGTTFTIGLPDFAMMKASPRAANLLHGLSLLS
jgi:hypothetical protein